MKIDQAINSLQSSTSPATGPKNEKAEPTAHKQHSAPSAPAAPSAGIRTAGIRTAGIRTTGGESLNISPLSTRMQNLESRLASGEVFDTARVNAIKQAIGDGSFKVNAEAVADKMISSAYDLFIKRH